MELSTVPHAALALACSEHRAGQLLTEARTHEGVSWLSPAQHDAPTPPVRPLPPLPITHPLEELSPLQQDDELWELADRPDDPERLELRAIEPDRTPQRDQLAELLRTGDTHWTLGLDEPYAWRDPIRNAAGLERCGLPSRA